GGSPASSRVRAPTRLRCCGRCTGSWKRWRCEHEVVAPPRGRGRGKPGGFPAPTLRRARRSQRRARRSVHSRRRGPAGETWFSPRDRAKGEGGGGVNSAAVGVRPRGGLNAGRLVRRHGWTVGVYVLLLVLVLFWRTIPANWGSFDVQSLAIDALPLAFAALAHSVVIISGGIDLSVGSLISLVNVLSAKYMVDMSFRNALLFGALLLAGSAAAGAFTGSLTVLSRVPDIVVTLAMLFVWAGVALEILQIPGGGAPPPYLQLGTGHWWSQWIPSGLVILLLGFAIFWLPLRWARPGLALYSVGSNRSAAYLSGVGVARTRILAYALGGLFAGLAGLALTATSGIGDPNAGQYYTLNSVAAAVLGGVALVGGVGGLIGPIAAAFVVTLVKTMLILKGVDQNWAQVIQGSLIIVVVMIGGLAIRRRGRT